MANDKFVRMSNYELIFMAYRSEQISERQWQKHLNDEVFRKWLICHDNKRLANVKHCSKRFLFDGDVCKKADLKASRHIYSSPC